MLAKEELAQLLAEKALGYLEYDDAHPDVGMGMFTSTAIEYAKDDIVQEAARWNALAALTVKFTDDIINHATEIIAKKRRR